MKAAECGLLILLLALPLGSAAQALKPFQAEYRLFRGDMNLGKATVALGPTEQAGCFDYHYVAKPSFLVRMFTGKISERSQFCLRDNQLVPRSYRYHRGGVGSKDENYELRFDPEGGVVTDDRGSQRDLPAGAVDRLLVQIAARRLVDGVTLPLDDRRRAIEVTVVEDDRMKTYEIAVMGHETLTVPAGTFETIRVERINDPKKTTRFWVAPALHYQLVRMEQVKADDPVIGFVLYKRPSFPAVPASAGSADTASTPGGPGRQ